MLYPYFVQHLPVHGHLHHIPSVDEACIQPAVSFHAAKPSMNQSVRPLSGEVEATLV